MANINLLPWREELRKEKTQQFATVTGFSVILTVCVIALIQFTIISQITYQKKRNKILEDEIASLDVALKEIEGLEETKEKLLSRMDIIQSLQQKRPQIVHLFDEIVRTIPEGIYLTGIKQTENTININGVAESNGRVSAYMRNIDGSNWMSTPKLTVIESKKGSLRSSDFVLTTSQSTPKSDEEEQG
jgi:type IV pilus assembly protein PilN